MSRIIRYKREKGKVEISGKASEIKAFIYIDLIGSFIFHLLKYIALLFIGYQITPVKVFLNQLIRHLIT